MDADRDGLLKASNRIQRWCKPLPRIGPHMGKGRTPFGSLSNSTQYLMFNHPVQIEVASRRGVSQELTGKEMAIFGEPGQAAIHPSSQLHRGLGGNIARLAFWPMISDLVPFPRLAFCRYKRCISCPGFASTRNLAFSNSRFHSPDSYNPFECMQIEHWSHGGDRGM